MKVIGVLIAITGLLNVLYNGLKIIVERSLDTDVPLVERKGRKCLRNRNRYIVESGLGAAMGFLLIVLGLALTYL